ncbi:hypothetical protein H3N56_02515 [Cetobacterium sp. 2A]|uniref:hypothetical protein n=1 Tax=Cetobacterium sp. 2A TaxID=2754723 RepID=UPI00163BE2B9|nr:hypothetical protein [Cetobacterium sp. 2A]MBC2855366.1 hypothetical protein [Cetobacterium sp. 2A]
MKKTLKDQFKQDVVNVFLNKDEFAQILKVQFPPMEEMELVGVLSTISDSWKHPRVAPINEQKIEETILIIDSEPFKEYNFKQGAEIYVNDIKYLVSKIRDNGYMKEFTLRRKEK